MCSSDLKAIKAKGNEPFAELFVPISKVGAARATLRDTNSDQAKAFKAAVKLEG